MKQMYFAVQGAEDIEFSVIDGNDEEIGNFHLTIHESEFGGSALVILMENGEIIKHYVINTGIENELDFGPVKTEMSNEEMNVFVVIGTSGRVTVSVK